MGVPQRGVGDGESRLRAQAAGPLVGADLVEKSPAAGISYRRQRGQLAGRIGQRPGRSR